MVNVLPELATTPVSRLRQRTLVRLEPSAPVAQAVDDLLTAHRGAAVVVGEAGELVGIFTEGDVLDHTGDTNPDWLNQPIGQLMTPDPVVIRSDDSLAEALRRMRTGPYHHLPVVGEDNRPNGMISIRDLLAYVVECFPQEFINLPPDPSLQAHRRWGG